jgi:hypothetical protein
MITLKARLVDSTHLELSRPVDTSKGRNVMVPIIESDETNTEREKWLAASKSGLQIAYGDSEPDYSASMIKEPNPEYKA